MGLDEMNISFLSSIIRSFHICHIVTLKLIFKEVKTKHNLLMLKYSRGVYFEKKNPKSCQFVRNTDTTWVKGGSC